MASIVYGREFTYQPPKGEIDILYQNDDFLIIDKPADLLSVPGKALNHADCLITRVQTQHPDARIVHRLDMATSGVMVLARNAAAQRHLGLQFERRHTQKTYHARVAGWVGGAINRSVPNGDPDDFTWSGAINLPLICDWPNRPLQMVDFERGKKARTDWVVMGRGVNIQGLAYTDMALYPITGRSHQLRVHMLALGHPILGDRLYATQTGFEASPRLMLQAQTLSFYNPDGGQRLSFESKLALL